MELAKDFFYDEVRDGFYIPGMVKRAWGGQGYPYFKKYEKQLKEVAKDNGSLITVSERKTWKDLR